MQSSDQENSHATSLDSDQQLVGELYGKALLKAAGDSRDALLEELDAIVTECLNRHPGLEQALASPRVKLIAKEEMLDRIFSGKVSATMLNFLKVLCRRGRIEFLRAIAIKATELRDEQLGRLRVQVTTAQDLNEEQIQQISERLSQAFGKQVSLRTRIDQSLIGGIVIRIGDQVFDGSVLGRIDSIRDHVSKNIQQSVRGQYESLLSS